MHSAADFEPFDAKPRLMETQVTGHPRYGIWDKSGRESISQGEVRHACTKWTLARLRPGRSRDPGRGNRRGRVARAEHLNSLREAAGLVIHLARVANRPASGICRCAPAVSPRRRHSTEPSHAE